VPREQADACLAQLRKAGYSHACAIGEIVPPSDELEPIVLRG
jgi:selenide, water dikinase